MDTHHHIHWSSQSPNIMLYSLVVVQIFKEDKQAVVTETKATPPPEPDPTSPQQSSSGDWLTRRNGLAEVWMASQLDSDTVVSVSCA